MHGGRDEHAGADRRRRLPCRTHHHRSDYVLHRTTAEQTRIRERLANRFPVIAQFAITVNSNVCPHIRVPNTLMRESYADVIGIFNSVLIRNDHYCLEP